MESTKPARADDLLDRAQANAKRRALEHDLAIPAVVERNYIDLFKKLAEIYG